MRYAIIKDKIVVNIAVATPEFAATQGWIACPLHDENNNPVQPGFLYENGKFSKPPRNSKEEWMNVRERRNFLLSTSDWTQGADISSETKEKWAVYRQILRNIPQTYSDPIEVVWPTKPE